MGFARNPQRGIGRGAAGMLPLVALVCVLHSPPLRAAPWAETGDIALRHELQLLADAGVIDGVLATWPVPWRSVAGALDEASGDALSPTLAAARRHVQAAAHRALVQDGTAVELRAAGVGKPPALRGYADTPRTDGEVSLGVENRSGPFAGRVRATRVADPPDGHEERLDGSYGAFLAGGWWLGVGSLDRWWGPGWDGSLVLSNNARPVPALFADRASAQPFASDWLAWLGPWRVSAFLGRLEANRTIGHARMLGLRIAFRPLPGLSVGLSRTALFGGDNRPEDIDTIRNLLLGKDNQAAGPDSDQPGDQLGGIDARWSLARYGAPVAAYGQLIGEDEAGGLPSKPLGQAGLETWGGTAAGTSWRLFAEFADTAARFQLSQPQFNAAYNHGVYTSGYRHYGRSMGHTIDGDSQLISLGGIVDLDRGPAFDWVLRRGRLNRDDGGVQPLAPRRTELASVTLGCRLVVNSVSVRLSGGAERIDPVNADAETNRFFGVDVSYRY